MLVLAQKQGYEIVISNNENPDDEIVVRCTEDYKRIAIKAKEKYHIFRRKDTYATDSK
jgi:sRNA-binding carbon storage regulator CsrA